MSAIVDRCRSLMDLILVLLLVAATVVVGGSAVAEGAEFRVPPVVEDQVFSVAENSPVGTGVGVIVVGDPEAVFGDEVTVTVRGGSGSAAFSVDAGSGVITVADSAYLDFETSPVLSLEVEATDLGGLVDTGIVTVNVEDVAAVTKWVAPYDFVVGGDPTLAPVDEADSSRAWEYLAQGGPFPGLPCEEMDEARLVAPWTWSANEARGSFTADAGCWAWNNVLVLPEGSEGLRGDPSRALGEPWTKYEIKTETQPGTPWRVVAFDQWSQYSNRLELTQGSSHCCADPHSRLIADSLVRNGWMVSHPFESGLGTLQSVEIEYFASIAGSISAQICDDSFLSNGEIEADATSILTLSLNPRVGSPFVWSRGKHIGTGHRTSWRCFLGSIIDALNSGALNGAPNVWDALHCMLDLENCVYQPPDWTEFVVVQGSEEWSGSLTLSPADYARNLGSNGDFRVSVTSRDHHDLWYEGGDTHDASLYLSSSSMGVAVGYVYEPVVPNHPPVADANGPYTAQEGSTVMFDATGSTDPDGDALGYTWNLSPAVPGFDGATGATVSHTFDDDYSGMITVTVEDPDGFTDTASAAVEVANVAPTAVFENDGPVNEGETFNLKLKDFYDPGGYDTQIWFEYRFDCGDGAGYGGLYPVTFEMCPTTDDGIRTVKGWIEDKDGGFTEYADTVTINDLAPMAGFSWAPEPSDEGSAVVFTDASVSAPDAIVGWMWDFDGLGSSTAHSPSFTFIDDGTYAVSLTVTDDDGSTNMVRHNVTVANVAPVLSNLTGDEVNEGSIAHLSGEISDVGVDDSFTVTVDWQDGYAPDEVAYPAGTTTFDLDHQYLDDKPSGTPSDTYQASVRVTDDDGGSTTKIVAMVVNNVAPAVWFDTVADGRPFTPVGIEVGVTAEWDDVGDPDTHTGTIDWGDGTISNLGDVMWGIAATHVYDAAGIYNIAVTVADDDTGTTTETVGVDIRDAADMSDGVADELLDLMGGADPAAREAIQGAIDDLIGNNDERASNGAEDQFAKGNLVAALGKLLEAAAQLEEIDGLDSTGQLVLLAMAAQSVAETETTEARKAAGCTDLNATTCSNGERKKVTTVEALLADGRTAIDSGKYVKAIEAFKDAIQSSSETGAVKLRHQIQYVGIQVIEV